MQTHPVEFCVPHKSGTRGDSRVCHWCSCHILTSSVIYYWKDARQHGIYLLYIIKKPITTEKHFNMTRKPAFAPQSAHFDKHGKKNWRNLLSIPTKRSYWLKKIVPLSNLTGASLLMEWKLTATAELNCEIYKTWRKCWKNRQFCHQICPVSWKAWTLPWILQELEKYAHKVCGRGQHWKSFNSSFKW